MGRVSRGWGWRLMPYFTIRRPRASYASPWGIPSKKKMNPILFKLKWWSNIDTNLLLHPLLFINLRNEDYDFIGHDWWLMTHVGVSVSSYSHKDRKVRAPSRFPDPQSWKELIFSSLACLMERRDHRVASRDAPAPGECLVYTRAGWCYNL